MSDKVKQAEDTVNQGYGSGAVTIKTPPQSGTNPSTAPADDQFSDYPPSSNAGRGGSSYDPATQEPGGSTGTNDKGLTMKEIMQATGLSHGQLAKAIKDAGASSKMTEHEKLQAQYRASLFSTYFQLWGKNAPKSLIDQAEKEGLNVYQFEDQIRQDPAFKRTETYQNEYADNALNLAHMLGIIPG